MKERLSQAITEAEKRQDKIGLAVLRLLNAVITDREKLARSGGNFEGLNDNDIYQIIVEFQKQREASAKQYDERGIVDLATNERHEIKVIQSLLPEKLTENEITIAVDTVIKKIGATSIRDKGRVMKELKARYQRGEMDFTQANPIVLGRLSSDTS
ncbi:MAG: GatB/YqeY domain-containing protein [Rhodobacteraceae bacterium]|nr:GatB/YqeY domain-containing protein [Paracoccaceae bacterium]